MVTYINQSQDQNIEENKKKSCQTKAVAASEESDHSFLD
jgi:hypothetical protein